MYKTFFQSRGSKENIFQIPVQLSSETDACNINPIQIPSSCCQNWEDNTDI